MRLITVAITMLVTILCYVQWTAADPIFAKLFGHNAYGGYGGGGGGYRGGYGGGGYGGGGYGGGGFGAPAPRRSHSRSDGARSYKQICRTINADSYANPRAVPFPAQPFCPF